MPDKSTSAALGTGPGSNAPSEAELRGHGAGGLGGSPRSSSSGASGPAGEARSVPQDCLGCRVTGCLFGVGGAAYLGSTLLQEPPPRGAHRYSVIAAAGTMFLFGMYRALA
ncbi:hypothetical protein PLESTB_001527200 [Pleodorina starrii]|uniref:DUF4536 domain-containing protein n=1 Tax=Pleodorina starrii TaxID=330485 RepID=A0A9W6F807_9CHLO|nr:hypothetical protein PLESTM_001166400 [Pleodorina starrii]GLC59728.1 hypothetical protein PLESTB_001527200 [Pleodorina starrii]GLC75350.1 hypothetical protein PLESTF_001626700 [Pleodorina starrii]